jgi:hypothetical protein
MVAFTGIRLLRRSRRVRGLAVLVALAGGLLGGRHGRCRGRVCFAGLLAVLRGRAAGAILA